MGMFDYVTCNSPLLPADLPRDGWQTKDFDDVMNSYEITSEGRLVLHRVRYEEVPEEERPHPEMLFIGSMRAIPDGDVDQEFHGIMEFYTETPDKWYVTMRAKFTDGDLVSIQEVSREDSPEFEMLDNGDHALVYRDRREIFTRNRETGDMERYLELPDGTRHRMVYPL